MTAESPVLTSLTNPRVKAAVRLRDRRERDRTGLTIVDGPRELLRALDRGIEIVEAFVSDELIRSDEAREASRRLELAAAPTIAVSAEVMVKVSFGDRSDGVVAVIRSPATDLDNLRLPTGPPLVVVVESVEKPGNLGAILRTADSAGADALLAADPLTDIFNPNAIRSSLGTIFSTPIAVASARATIDWLAANGIRPIAALVDAPTPYTEVDLRGPIAVALGSEASGLSEAWDDPRVTAVGIPMFGAADSLNVSVAAAIILYEAVRQRT